VMVPNAMTYFDGMMQILPELSDKRRYRYGRY